MKLNAYVVIRLITFELLLKTTLTSAFLSCLLSVPDEQYNREYFQHVGEAISNVVWYTGKSPKFSYNIFIPPTLEPQVFAAGNCTLENTQSEYECRSCLYRLGDALQTRCALAIEAFINEEGCTIEYSKVR